MKKILFLLAAVVMGFCASCDDETTYEMDVTYNYFIKVEGPVVEASMYDYYLKNWLDTEISKLRTNYEKSEDIHIKAVVPEAKLTANDAKAIASGAIVQEAIRNVHTQFNAYISQHADYTYGQPISLTIRYVVERPDLSSIKESSEVLKIKSLYKSDTFHFDYEPTTIIP